MNTQAFCSFEAPSPSIRGGHDGFGRAECLGFQQLLIHLHWVGVQPAAHKLSPMKIQAFSPSEATVPSFGNNGDFVQASCPSPHQLLTNLPWVGVQPAAHKLSPMKTQAFCSPKPTTLTSGLGWRGFFLASRPSTHRLLTHLPWDGVQPATHKLSQMNTQAFRSSEAPSPSIRHDNVFTSHRCPRKPKKPTKARAIWSPDVIPFVRQHHPWCWPPPPKGSGGRPHGRPRSTSRPPTCNARKNNIRGNILSVATCFCEHCMCGKGRGCGGGGLLACKGGAKSSKQYSPIEHICQILTWQGETSTCPRSHNGP